MIIFLNIDSAKMKRKQTSLTTFLAEKVCQGKAIMSINALIDKIVCMLMLLFC